MDKDKSINILNTLIEINNDRIAGYETALSETEEEDLQVLFSQFGQTSKKFKLELSAEVGQLDGIPATGTKTTGKVFRAWMGFKTILTGHHSRPILNSCELGEDEVVEAYDNALTNHLEDLSEEQQIMLNAQYALIKTEFDQIKSKRDSVAEQK